MRETGDELVTLRNRGDLHQRDTREGDPATHACYMLIQGRYPRILVRLTLREQKAHLRKEIITDAQYCCASAPANIGYRLLRPVRRQETIWAAGESCYASIDRQPLTFVGDNETSGMRLDLFLLFRVKRHLLAAKNQKQRRSLATQLLRRAYHHIILLVGSKKFPWRLQQFKELRCNDPFSRVDCNTDHLVLPSSALVALSARARMRSVPSNNPFARLTNRERSLLHWCARYTSCPRSTIFSASSGCPKTYSIFVARSSASPNSNRTSSR